ncbi:MAG: sigma-70 family RNA polymerase sigma factor [Bacilli bacterium]|nr:sigma-70 family RNA polymerase sigma factor [Bacilli bacterium]
MKYNNYNDYELIYMVRENDDNSSDILYQKYYPIIHNLANSFYQLNKYYGYDFEDFLQEANLAFYKALSSYNEKEDTLFYTFVVICIRRKLLSFSKKIANKKNNYSSLDCISIEEVELEDVQSNFDMLIEKNEIDNIIHDFLYSLPFDSACIFELKMNGYTYREMSILLDAPISSLEFKHRTSNEKLKKLLHDFSDKMNICKKKTI